jgi:transcriptional regulator PpsR
VQGLQSSPTWFEGLNAGVAANLVHAASDLLLSIDRDSLIREVFFSTNDLAEEFPPSQAWTGKPWMRAIAPDSHPKIHEMLQSSSGPSRWRHVNFLSNTGSSIALLCTVVALRQGDQHILLGRDMRAMSGLQQRLVQAQQSLERDYGKLRDAEARYRVVFKTAAEPIMILDAGSQRILEANPAATQLLTRPDGRGMRPLADLFLPVDRSRLEGLLQQVRMQGGTQHTQLTLAGESKTCSLAATLFRQQLASLILVRLDGEAPALEAGKRNPLLNLIERAPDAFVVTDPAGRILAANMTFLDLAEVARADQVAGESLDRWLGRPGVDLDVLLGNLRQHGSVRLFATRLRGEFGAMADVEVSAAAIGHGTTGRLGFAIRDVGARLPGAPRDVTGTGRSAEQITQLIGRVPLKDLVRDATDMIERLCIEAALELTADNRAAAAEMLGLSRQSLYVKLRRYGLGDLAGDKDEA